MSWSKTYSKRIAALGLCIIALAGGGVAAAGCASASSNTVMPKGMHSRTIYFQINDCGKHNAGQRKIIVWRGNGDRQSALFCPNGTVWPS